MKQLLILSGKGGTGKTTLASAFIELSEAKAYADCDVDAPNLHLIMNIKSQPESKDYFGLGKAVINQDLCISCGLCYEHCKFDTINETDGVYEVFSYACEGCGVCEYICPVEAVKLYPDVAGELYLYKEKGKVFSTAKLKMGSGTSGKLVTEVKKQMRLAAPDEKFAIIDGSPGIGCPVIASISGVSMVLIVTEPSVSGISDMERILQTAAAFQTKTAVCINKSDTNTGKTKEIEEYCRKNNIEMVGKIPFDPVAVETINAGKTLANVDCPSSRAIGATYQNTMKLFLGNGESSK
ncbi:ATP-binding protein [Alkalibacter mobilis]|uniref:ATP-binding protein n=1 Tax=Alkalibacter mobilis TaxID=2787712 RepID=UPI00189DD1D2|nr:ATP-binding protein [Alkalibacter mobilis]MBF7096197.1 ATP-binding protein [Alkalibacter mobilis]